MINQLHFTGAEALVVLGVFYWFLFLLSIADTHVTFVSGVQHNDSSSLPILLCSPQCSYHLSPHTPFQYHWLHSLCWAFISFTYSFLTGSLARPRPCTHFAHPPPLPLRNHPFFCIYRSNSALVYLSSREEVNGECIKRNQDKYLEVDPISKREPLK